MRLPNGYGSVVKLSGKRRNPYMVRKTVGWKDNAHPIYAIIGYFPTRKTALDALAEYNRDPYDLDLAKATFEEIYGFWSKETFPTLKESMKKSYAAAYKHCEPIHEKTYRNIRKGHMQDCINQCGKGYSTRSNIKTLLNQLDKYAFDHDIISKGYAQNLDIGDKEASDKHKPVTDSEVIVLWKHQGEPYVDDTLFMLYTGCRVSEMLRMKISDIDLDNMTMVGGVKTSYGKNRIIPIHSKLLPIIKKHYNEENTYLFQYRENQETDGFSRCYREKWNEAMKNVGFNHLTHDCRHTVRSKLDSAGANKVAIDRIMGHSSNGIGEKVYTHKTVEELKEAIEMLVYGSAEQSQIVT